MNSQGNENCILNILSFIYNLQQSATGGPGQDNSCTQPMLGLNTNLNTRPVTLYLCNNTELSIQYPGTTPTTPETSTIFRVEGINGSCVVVRLLTDDGGTITSTGEFATINTDCIAAIRCLPDVSITL